MSMNKLWENQENLSYFWDGLKYLPTSLQHLYLELDENCLGLNKENLQ